MIIKITITFIMIINIIITKITTPRFRVTLHYFNVRFDLDVLPFSKLRQVEAEVKVKVENPEG